MDLVDFLRLGAHDVKRIERAKERGLDREAVPNSATREKPRSRSPRAVTSSMSTTGNESRVLRGPSAICGVTAGIANKVAPTLRSSATKPAR